MAELSVPVRLAGFAAVVAVAVGGAFGIGNAVGPIGTSEPAAEAGHGHDDTTESSHAEHAPELPGGLQISERGYSLHLTSRTYEPGEQTIRFRVLDEQGDPVTEFDAVHEARLHFFAVRRDLGSFAHLHPTLGEGGEWSITTDLTPGPWRFLADFQPTGEDEQLTLGRDAFVAGDYNPAPLPKQNRTATVDGYTVNLSGDLAVGEGTELTLNVSKDGRPVTDLQPYLGAYGHLVALRDGDLAYLHVHPEQGESGPAIAFHAEAPSTGDYRLFLDFKHEGVVRTAAFTVRVGPDGPTVTDQPTVPSQVGGSDGGHDHRH